VEPAAAARYAKQRQPLFLLPDTCSEADNEYSPVGRELIGCVKLKFAIYAAKRSKSIT
jgi:hypothetical protein